jgi:hypothetical protein
MDLKKDKILEAILVITTGFLVLFLFYGKDWMLWIAVGAGLSGIFVKPLAKLLAFSWFKLGEIMGFVVSKVVLALLFFFLFVPIAFLHNLFNPDTLKLKRTKGSLWSERNIAYSPENLKNSW